MPKFVCFTEMHERRAMFSGKLHKKYPNKCQNPNEYMTVYG